MLSKRGQAMRLSTGLAAAVITVSPVADAADGPERQDGKTRIVARADLQIAASEADDGTTLKIAPGKEFLVALHGKIGADGGWRILQFDSAVLQGIGEPEVQLEPKPDPNAFGFLSRETFRFRARRTGETGLAFAFFNPWKRTPPEEQVRILVRAV